MEGNTNLHDSNLKSMKVIPNNLPRKAVGVTKSRTHTGLSLKQMALCGLMGGLCAVLMMFRFPLPFMPPFMSFDFAGLVEIIGGFTMGPLAALAIIVIKVLIQIITQGTKSAYTGELQSLILSCAYVLPAVIIYTRHKSKMTALTGMIAGTIICAIVAIFTNLYIIIPFYASFSGFTLDNIIEMCAAVNPIVSNKWTLAAFGIIPFNLIKNGALSVITFLVYKKISSQIKHFIQN